MSAGGKPLGGPPMTGLPPGGPGGGGKRGGPRGGKEDGGTLKTKNLFYGKVLLYYYTCHKNSCHSMITSKIAATL